MCRPHADVQPLLAKSMAAKEAGGVELLLVLQDILQVTPSALLPGTSAWHGSLAHEPWACMHPLTQSSSLAVQHCTDRAWCSSYPLALLHAHGRSSRVCEICGAWGVPCRQRQGRTCRGCWRSAAAPSAHGSWRTRRRC